MFRGKLALCVSIVAFFALVTALPIEKAPTTAVEAERLLQQVSGLLSADKSDAAVRLAKARKRAAALEERLTQASTKEGQTELRLAATKKKFEKYVGDHSSCLVDLKALDEASLISLKKLNQIKSTLVTLSETGVKPKQTTATDVQVQRPHDKLVDKMSNYIDVMVSKVAKTTSAKRATCDKIKEVMNEENGLRNKVIKATANHNNAEDIFNRVRSELTAEKKTIQILEEEQMNTGMLIDEELEKVKDIKDAVSAMTMALKTSVSCAPGSQLQIQSQRLSMALNSLVSNMKKLKVLQAKKVVENRKIKKQVAHAEAVRSARLDAFRQSVSRMEQRYRVLTAEEKADHKHCLVDQSVREKEAQVLKKLIELLTEFQAAQSIPDHKIVSTMLQAVVPIAGNALRKALILIQGQKASDVAEVIRMLKTVQSQLKKALKNCNRMNSELQQKTFASEQAFTKKKATQEVLKNALRQSKASKQAASKALMNAKMLLLQTGDRVNQKTEILGKTAKDIAALCH